MVVRRRLRVELPDRPGALARLAALLAAHGADVESVDIHEVDAGTAVDEIVVAVAEGWDPSGFAAAIEADGSGRLLAAAASGPGGDRVVAALHWSRHLVETGVQHSELELASTIAQLCAASTAWVGGVGEAELDHTGAEALELGHSVVAHLDELPLRLSGETMSSGWVLAVVDDPVQPRRVALVGRATGLPFTRTEIARIEALLGLAYELSIVG